MKLAIKGEIENKPKLVITDRGTLKATVSFKDDGQFIRVSTYNANLINVILQLKANAVHVIKGNVGFFFTHILFKCKKTKYL